MHPACPPPNPCPTLRIQGKRKTISPLQCTNPPSPPSLTHSNTLRNAPLYISITPRYILSYPFSPSPSSNHFRLSIASLSSPSTCSKEKSVTAVQGNI